MDPWNITMVCSRTGAETLLAGGAPALSVEAAPDAAASAQSAALLPAAAATGESAAAMGLIRNLNDAVMAIELGNRRAREVPHAPTAHILAHTPSSDNSPPPIPPQGGAVAASAGEKLGALVQAALVPALFASMAFVAEGASVITCPSLLNVRKATYGHSWYWARSVEY
jgi:hypothetical protein